METINLGAAEGLPPVSWDGIAERLEAGSAPAPDAHNARTTWLATLNQDGSAHVTAVGAIWLDGTFWFQTGGRTLKHRNVERDPRCSLAVSVRDADVVIEGEAVRVREPDLIARVAKAWADQGWPAEPDPTGSGSRPLSMPRPRAPHRGTSIGSRPARPPSCSASNPEGRCASTSSEVVRASYPPARGAVLPNPVPDKP